MGEIKTTYEVKLPCKPVVKQYLVNKLGENFAFPNGPYKKNWIKLLLLQLLQRGTAEKDSEITHNKYTEVVMLKITYEEFQRFGDTLSRTAICEINNRIEDEIHQQLFQFLEFYVHVAKYQLKDAIEMFQQVYAFPEDVYAGETIKKYYQRQIQPYVRPVLFIARNVPFKKKRRNSRAA